MTLPFRFVRFAQRAALSLGLAAILCATQFAPSPVQAADAAPADAAPAVQRDRDQAIHTLAVQLEKIGEELARIQPVGAVKRSSADVAALKGKAEPQALTARVLDEVDALGDFESQIAADWNAEAQEMQARGLPGEVVARHEALLAEVLQRAGEFRSLVAGLRSARARGGSAVAAPLADLADWFAQQPRARGWRAIDRQSLPTQFARADATRAPAEPASSGDVTPAAAADPPGPADLAQTLEVQFTAPIQELAQSLHSQPVAIRNWVYDHIEFHPTFGSVQGADLTLLARRGNAFDIASLTLALLRSSGIPARYAHGLVEIPIAQVQNWLGNVGTPQMAVDMMQKGGIPAAAVIAGGKIVAVRFEHVWVEAWVDFIPSRGAINRVPDQWVPFDVAYKQFDYAPRYDWRQKTFAARQQASADFIAHVSVDATGGIKGFDFDKLNQDMGAIAKQLANDLRANDPNVDQTAFEEPRTIRPIDSLILEGSLPYPLRSANIARYDELPAALRQTAEVEFFTDESSIALESPSQSYSLPLARLGTQRFGVDYAPATPADAATIASYAASNAASMPVGQINVVPRLMLGDEVLFAGGATRMGTPHYWHVNIKDAQGHTTTTEAYNFAAGSAIVFGADLGGVTPERVEREGAGLPDAATLPQRDALYYAGLLYWGMTDHLDQQAARSAGGYALRLPSIGAFAQPYQVSYFFGVPRNGYVNGHVTDIKAVRVGMSVPKASDFARVALHAGSAGSMAEGATWSLLQGAATAGLGMSATTALKLAVDNGQRIFQIDRTNLDTAMAQLQLSSFAEDEIRQSVQAGMIVIAHEKEVHYKGWSGSGYVVFDPQSGNSLQRVEGGLAGGIDIGCIAQAVLLEVLCRTKFIKAFKRILFQLAKDLAARIMEMTGVEALLAAVAPEAAVILPIIFAVYTAISVIQATYEVLTWVREIMDGIENLTPEDLAQLGINAINDIACSYSPPCLGGFGGFFGGGGGGGGGGEGDGGGTFAGGGASGGWGGGDGGSGGPTAGNPVAIGSGTKWQTEEDYLGDGVFPLHFSRTYASTVPSIGGFVGSKWTATYFQSVRLPPSVDGSPFPVDQRPDGVLVTRPDGGWYQFDWRGTAYFSESNIPGRLDRLTSAGNTTGWRYTTPQDEVETYDAHGRLLSIANRAGVAQTVTYDAAMRPVKVTHTFGRTLEFAYGDDGYLQSVKDPAQREIAFEHDGNGNLTKAIYPDQKVREYVYDDPTQRYQLTGLIDERGVRLATWSYDHEGRVLSSEHAGGVERYTFRYESDRTIVVDPLGTERTYAYVTYFNRRYLSRVTEPCSSCGSGVAAETTYDGRGLIASRKDFEGRTTRYSRNDRGLIETLTEAADTSLARTVKISWHPVWYLPLTLDEPIEGGSRHTVFAYDAQGNLRSRTVTAAGETRVWTFDYDSHGQLTVEDGPRQDVADRTTFAYDPTTGDLSSATDAAGHTLHIVERDADGRPRQSEDANGRITRFDYDPRGRMIQTVEKTSASDLGETILYGYTPTGALQSVTLADGSVQRYGYDAAERLTDLTDSLGQHEHYTLDPDGNRTVEEVYDASNHLLGTQHFVFDPLGRIQAQYGADPHEAVTYGYDQDGNNSTITDALGHVNTMGYDGLSRLAQSDVLAADDPDHQRVVYGYDANDNLASVTDPRGLVTRYAYSGFDELLKTTSPDTGVSTRRFDAAGNLSVSTDARNQRALYAYDALGRLTQARFGAAAANDPTAQQSVEETLSLAYDEVGGGDGAIGQLTHFDDAAGTTHLRYDRHGRMIEKQQALGDGAAVLVKTVARHYDASGHVDQLTLPSGAAIGYTYGADGRVLTISVNGIVVVRDVEYFPFGEPKGWTEGSSVAGFHYRRGFDAAGRLKSATLGDATREFSFDAASRVVGLVDTATPGSGVPYDAASAHWVFGYDGQDRLTGATNAASAGPLANLALEWTHDATGNRLGQTRNSVPTAYSIAADSNRLAAIGAVARTYDEGGNTASDGTYRYATNARGRLSVTRLQGSGAVVARYAYNARGERVCKASGESQCPGGPGRAIAPDAGSGAFTQYVYDEDAHLLGEYSETGSLVAEHLWLGDTPVAVLMPAAFATSHGGIAAVGSGASVAVFPVEPDQLDTPRAVVNAAHQTVWSWDAAPYGDTLANENPHGAGVFRYSPRFPGQQFDVETGLHYNLLRDFEPATGRYVQSDLLGLAAGPNTFAYAFSNPQSFTDPSGLKGKGKGGCGKNCKGRRNGHHSDPKVYGGDPLQPLTDMCESCHKNLHREMWDFMDNIVDAGSGRSMRPKPGNSGADIMRTFGRLRCLKALACFYKGPGSKYVCAAGDFFKQHPKLK